ncbi:hypothetical protein ACLOJK_002792 [Asimina triloba]
MVWTDGGSGVWIERRAVGDEGCWISTESARTLLIGVRTLLRRRCAGRLVMVEAATDLGGCRRTGDGWTAFVGCPVARGHVGRWRCGCCRRQQLDLAGEDGGATSGERVIVDGDGAEDGSCACRRWILNDRPAGVVMNGPDRSIGASPEDPSPAAMAAGFEEDDGAPNPVLRWCTVTCIHAV